MEFNRKDKVFCKLFPQFLKPNSGSSQQTKEEKHLESSEEEEKNSESSEEEEEKKQDRENRHKKKKINGTDKQNGNNNLSSLEEVTESSVGQQTKLQIPPRPYFTFNCAFITFLSFILCFMIVSVYF